MRVNNLQIYREDEAVLRSLADDYIFLGYKVKLVPGRLTVFATSRKKKADAKKRGAENSEKSDRGIRNRTDKAKKQQ